MAVVQHRRVLHPCFCKIGHHRNIPFLKKCHNFNCWYSLYFSLFIPSATWPVSKWKYKRLDVGNLEGKGKQTEEGSQLKTSPAHFGAQMLLDPPSSSLTSWHFPLIFYSAVTTNRKCSKQGNSTMLDVYTSCQNWSHFPGKAISQQIDCWSSRELKT